MNFFTQSIFLCLIYVACINADSSPVLDFFRTNAHLTKVNGLGKTLNKDAFINSISGSIKSEIDLIVVENLKDEDVRFFLKKADLKDNVDYMPSVESPYESIVEYFNQHPNIKANVYEENTAEEALSLFLIKQNDLKTDGVILTSKTTHVRHARQASAGQSSDNSTTIKVFGDVCAAIFDSIYVIDSTGQSASKPIDLDVSGITFTCQNNNSTALLNIQFANNTAYAGNSISQISMAFSSDVSRIYWKLSSANATANNKQYGVAYMGAPYSVETPLGFSFVCTRTRFQLYDPSTDSKPYVKVSIYIENFQIQPFNMNSTGYSFNRPNYCQGFFSAGIWMAITASLLLTLILACGVSFLFSVKTMDRFDDPKGKPLTIAAEK